MPKNNGNKVRVKKQNKTRKHKSFKCLECLDTGVIDKGMLMPCPYCDAEPNEEDLKEAVEALQDEFDSDVDLTYLFGKKWNVENRNKPGNKSD